MSTKAREFFICDETDNSGYSVREWSEKEANRQFGACNVFHVIEYSAYEELKKETAKLNRTNERLAMRYKELVDMRTQNEIMAEALSLIANRTMSVYVDYKDGMSDKMNIAREALAKCGKGGSV